MTTKYALISVFNKVGIRSLSKYLMNQNYTILSTGGTFKTIAECLTEKERNERLVQVSNFTGFPEILNGRVKTLHPKIYGGLLAKRNDAGHLAELKEHDIPPIDLVVCNLYPFDRAVKENLDLDQALELIDIGGVTLIRAAAKNWPSVTILSDPLDYSRFEQEDSSDFRKELAVKAYQHTSRYDSMISKYLDPTVSSISRTYHQQYQMKYGCNPQQDSSMIMNLNSNDCPIKLLNGTPGYINLLDALNSWQLVHEAGQIFKDTPVVASFKHTSPAGVALYHSKLEPYDASDPTSITFLNARYCDPKSSFGDFLAINQVCDEATAKLIRREVSDGIIAPGFTPEAFEILSKKKKGKYLVLQVDPEYRSEQQVEIREMFGLALTQAPNRAIVNHEVFNVENVPTENKTLSDQAKNDLLLANITLKYAQSNNVVMAKDGQIIGVAAGQQSRVDAVKLAGRKASIWYLRQHPKAQNLYNLFKPTVKRQQKTNAIIDYVEGDMTEIQRPVWEDLFETVPEPLTQAEKDEFLKTLTGVSMASDAFFPFRDNIDHASKFGVSYIMQPGGSLADARVVEACNQYGMVMTMTGQRMFTH